MPRGLLIVVICLLSTPFGVSPSFSQQCSNPVCISVEVPQPATDSSLAAGVRITDSYGRPYLGLTEENLLVSVNGASKKVNEMYATFSDSDYLGVVFVVDRSGSIESDSLDKVREAIHHIASTFAPYDQVGVVSTVRDSVYTSLPLGTSPNRVRDWAQTIHTTEGNTALFDAIGRGIEMLNQSRAPRRGLIVFSDGKDTQSTSTKQEIHRKLKAVDWPVFTVGTGKSIALDTLQGFSSVTGGRYYESPTQFYSLYRRLVEPLRGLEYVLEFPFEDSVSSYYRLVVKIRYANEVYKGSVQFRNPFLISR